MNLYYLILFCATAFFISAQERKEVRAGSTVSLTFEALYSTIVEWKHGNKTIIFTDLRSCNQDHCPYKFSCDDNRDRTTIVFKLTIPYVHPERDSGPWSAIGYTQLQNIHQKNFVLDIKVNITVSGPRAVRVGSEALFTCILPGITGFGGITVNFHNENSSEFIRTFDCNTQSNHNSNDFNDTYCVIYENLSGIILLLTVKNISHENQGFFSCSHGNHSSKDHRLLVYDEETPDINFLDSSAVVEITEKRQLTLTCETHPSFSKVEVVWLRNGTKINDNGTTYRICHENGSTNVISRLTTLVTMDKSGTAFQCMVHNVLTPQSTKLSLTNVTVIVPAPDWVPTYFIIGVVATGTGVSMALVCAMAAWAASRRRRRRRRRGDEEEEEETRRRGRRNERMNNPSQRRHHMDNDSPPNEPV